MAARLPLVFLFFAAAGCATEPTPRPVDRLALAPQARANDSASPQESDRIVIRRRLSPAELETAAARAPGPFILNGEVQSIELGRFYVEGDDAAFSVQISVGEDACVYLGWSLARGTSWLSCRQYIEQRISVSLRSRDARSFPCTGRSPAFSGASVSQSINGEEIFFFHGVTRQEVAAVFVTVKDVPRRFEVPR